jgi:hypothetical protein
VEGGAPTLFHTTIARNAGGDASGLYLTHSGALALTNTILASQATGIVVNTGSTASVDGVLWYANTSDSGGDGTFSASNATTGDPAFAADGYHILSRSAAIDAGIDAKVEEDIDGQPRPYRTADLGADEYWPSGTTSRIFLPLMLSGHH